MTVDVLVIAPFRRPTFRKAISSRYPVREPWDSPPLSLAGGLEQHGLQVAYLALQNLFDSWDEARDLPVLRSVLRSTPARMAVFTGDYFIPSRSTATLFGMSVIARELKAEYPDMIIGATGRLPTTAGAQLLEQVPECGFLVHGEPDAVIGDIAGQILRHGAAARHESLVTRATAAAGQRPHAATTATLDETPMPAWRLLERSMTWWEQLGHGTATDPIPFSLRTSAGCRFRCRFCAGVPNWLNYRTKSAPRVAAELDALAGATGGRAHFAFLEDEIFTRDLEHVKDISGICVARGIRFDGLYTHSSLLTPQVAGHLATMTHRVFLGLDSPDDQILRGMGKGQRFDTVLAAVETARAAGLGTHLEWIIGSPADTVDSLIASLNLLTTLYATGVVESINTYVYCPHPGTEYAEHPGKYGLHLIDGLEDMQESGGYPAYRTQHLTRQQIFTAYLMSQLALAEIGRDRDRGVVHTSVGTPSRGELHRIFGKLTEPTDG
ncbi:B12-binding domain-containing radical SAM protein [Streptomyces sp. NPDC057654]|uniref:B12-binding domain-containing radical SAM protein n=1 Tax=Streptomyces sp. NPDC057654 TaxID=3346196 RepID=UPI0036CB6C3D